MRCLMAAVFIFGPSLGSGQELGLSTPDKNVVMKVAGVVQYVEGRVVKTEPSGVQTEVVYQTPIYEGDRLESTSGAVTKIATRSSCLVVSRGQGAAAAPSEKKPWRFRAESIRIICSEKPLAETFGISNVPFSIKRGEALILDEPLRAMSLSGQVHVRSKALELRKLYAVGATVTEISPQPNENELRQLNLKERPPHESTEWPEIAKPPTVRVIFGPVFGGDQVLYDASDLSQKGMSGNGPRLQLHFRTQADHSIIVSATSRESTDKDRESGPNRQPADGVNSHLEFLLLEGGYRYHHDKWWSPFFKFGGCSAKSRIAVQNNFNGNLNSQNTYTFYVASASFGVDANLLPKFLSPFGFYASAEAQAIQSLWRDSARVSNYGNQNGSQEPYRLTSFDITLGLGVQYQF